MVSAHGNHEINAVNYYAQFAMPGNEQDYGLDYFTYYLFFIGAVCISVLLSLVATPIAYFLMLQLRDARVFKMLRPRE